MAWLGVVYLGALAMIFATAFFTTDSFTGAVVRDFTLENYREVLTPTYLTDHRPHGRSSPPW